MADYSTGAVGPTHRAVMCRGRVLAVAEETQGAADIVRALNNEQARRQTAQRLVVMRDQIENLLIEIGARVMTQGEIRDRVRALLTFDPRSNES